MITFEKFKKNLKIFLTNLYRARIKSSIFVARRRPFDWSIHSGQTRLRTAIPVVFLPCCEELKNSLPTIAKHGTTRTYTPMYPPLSKNKFDTSAPITKMIEAVNWIYKATENKIDFTQDPKNLNINKILKNSNSKTKTK